MLVEEKKQFFALFFYSPELVTSHSHWPDIFAFLQASIQKYKLKRASCQMQPTRREAANTNPFYSWQ